MRPTLRTKTWLSVMLIVAGSVGSTVADEGPIPLLTLKGYETTVLQVSFSPDGQRLVIANSDGRVEVWDISWLMRKQTE